MVLFVVERSGLGKIIYDARRARRWSLLTLEAKTDDAGWRVGASTIRGIENGSQVPTPRSLRGLAAALKLDYEQLLKDAGHLLGEDGDAENWPPDVQELADRLIALRPHRRQRVLPAIGQLIDALAEEEAGEADR